MQPVLAVSDLRGTRPLLQDCPFPVVQAPTLRQRGDASFVARRFEDVLAASGFADEPGLASVLRAWDNLLDLLRPAVVVTNHAPALALAAYGRLPCVVTGTGFTVPPGDGAAFPILMSGATDLAAQGLNEVVGSVLASRNRPAPAALTELYRRDCYPLTVTELDPYATVRTSAVFGPLRPLPAVLPVSTTDRFFAYLSADAPWAAELLSGLAEVARGSAYLRGADEPTLQRLEAAGLNMWRVAPPLAEVLPAASVVLHHGSHATAQEALAAGRAQVCLPRHLEQILTGHLLEQLGVGRSLRGQILPGVLAEALQSMRSSDVADRAAAVASDVHRRGQAPALEVVADRCFERAASG
jgi:UDP:flavonoid glycosyltransferase YjiC (YdhE family)